MLGRDVFLAPTATLVGDVKIGDGSSIWFNTVVRADINEITIGKGTNLQDGVVVHVTRIHPVFIGNHVTIGHGAVLHGCRIEDEVLIGMGAIILDGALIEHHCIIAAGSVVRPGTRIPEGHLAAGIPAQVKRPLTPEEIQEINETAKRYQEYARETAQALGKAAAR